MRVIIELEQYEVDKKLDFCLNLVDELKTSTSYVYHRIDDLTAGRKRIVISVPTIVKKMEL